MQRTLKRELKVLEIVKREAIGVGEWSWLTHPDRAHRHGVFGAVLRGGTSISAWCVRAGVLWPGPSQCQLGWKEKGSRKVTWWHSSRVSLCVIDCYRCFHHLTEALEER